MRRVHRSLVPLAALPLLLTALSGSLYGALSAQGIEALVLLGPGAAHPVRDRLRHGTAAGPPQGDEATAASGLIRPLRRRVLMRILSLTRNDNKKLNLHNHFEMHGLGLNSSPPGMRRMIFW